MKKSNYKNSSLLDKEIRLYTIAFIAVIVIVIGEAFMLYKSSSLTIDKDQNFQEEVSLKDFNENSETF